MTEMIFTDEAQLLDKIAGALLKAESDFVVYSAISPWHAIGVDMLAYKVMQEYGSNPSGVVVIRAHPKDGFVIRKDDFVCPDFAGVEFFYLDTRGQPSRDSIFKGLQLLDKELKVLLGIKSVKGSKKNRKFFHIGSVIHPNVSFIRLFRNRIIADKYCPVFSLLDEGLGTYMTGDVWRLLFDMHREERRSNRSRFRIVAGKWVGKVTRLIGLCAMILIYGSIVKNIGDEAKKYIPSETLFVFHKVGGKLVPDKQIAGYYREVIERRAARRGKIEKVGNPVMLLTQPFSEYNQISAEAELGIVERVVDIVGKGGYEVVLKPHPREHPDKYLQLATRFGHTKVRISEHSMPAEELFSVMCPACVIGYTSTALAIASAVYNIPAITILDLLLDKTEDEYIKVHGAEFKKLTSDIVHRADSFDKLGEILSTVVSGNTAIQ